MFLTLSNALSPIITRLEEVVKNLVRERGTEERAHQAEIARLENMHMREVDALKMHICYLSQYNDRLFKLALGVDPLDESKEEKPAQTEQFQATPTTVAGNLIKRDKDRTTEYRAYLEQKAQEIQLQQSKSDTEQVQ